MNFRVTDSVRKEPSAASRMTWCGLLSRKSRRRDARGSSRKLAEVRSSTNSSPESIPHSSSQRANGSKDTERVTTLSWRRFASLRSWPDVYRKTATLRNESAKRLNPSGIGFVSAAKIFPFWSKNPPSPNVPKFTRTSWNEFWNKKRLLDVPVFQYCQRQFYFGGPNICNLFQDENRVNVPDFQYNPQQLH